MLPLQSSMLSPLLTLRRDGGDGHPAGADLGGEKNCGQLGGDPCRTEPVIDEDTSHAHPAQGDWQWPCRSLRQPRHAQLMQGHSFPKQPVDTRRSSVQLRWCTARLQWEPCAPCAVPRLWQARVRCRHIGTGATTCSSNTQAASARGVQQRAPATAQHSSDGVWGASHAHHAPRKGQ